MGSLPKNYPVRSLIVATLWCVLALPAVAHDGADDVLATPVAPLSSAAVETMTGTIDDLIVENRVTGVTKRYVALQQISGENISLEGENLSAFAKGAAVQASGRRSGNTLFVTAAHAVGSSSTPTLATPKAQGAMQAQGTLLLAHADDFAHGRSQFMLNVNGTDGTTTSLKVAVLPDALQVGMSVIAVGSLAADGFSIAASRIIVTALAAPKVDDAKRIEGKAASTNNVLVVLIKFSDSANLGANLQTQPFTPQLVQQVMISNPASVAAYYSEVSYGQHLLNVTVTNWLQSTAATPSGCDYNTIATLANTAATAATFNVGSNPPGTGAYQNVFYVFESNAACGWAGLAYISYGRAWSNGYNLLPVFAHELGHNFGLLHAASLRCTGQTITTGLSGCSESEYGDPFDVMGDQGSSSVAMHFNATQKSILNWLPAGSVATYGSGTSTYTLTPLESSGGSTYAVKIPASSTRTYWMEYRQNIGLFDSAYGFNGAQIRLQSPFESGAVCSPNTGCADDTQLLDMTPGTTNSDFHDAALLAGQSFTDTTYGITMSVLSTSPSALTAQESSAGATATTTTVASSSNPSTSGVSVTFTATVTGTNPTGTVNFKDGGTSISGCSASALGGSGNSKTAACSTSALTAGTHSIVAGYGGDGSNTASSSSALSQGVNAAIATSSTAVSSNLNAAAIGASVTFTAMVTGSNPTGTVNFMDGTSSVTGCASAALGGSGNSRAATCTASSLAQGTHSIVASYGGDSNNGASASSTLIEVVRPLFAARSGDYNGDGKGDLLLHNTNGQTAVWLMNGLTTLTAAIVYNDINWTVIGGGDFNGDGKTDLLWRNAATGQTAIWLMNGVAPTSSAIIIGDPNWVPVGTGDFNGDGKTDLLLHNAATGQTAIWLMNGLVASTTAIVMTDPNWVPIATGDFDGDGKTDLLWHNAATGQTAIWLMNGVTTTASAIIYGDVNWTVTTTGDFNGDGKTDLLWHNTATGQTAIWLMNGITPSATAVVYADPNWTVTATGDFNGDGKTDLLWSNTATGQTAIWLMSGTSTTASAVVYADPTWTVVGTADFDGNGKSDLMWRNTINGQSAIWLMNGLGASASAVVSGDSTWFVAPSH